MTERKTEVPRVSREYLDGIREVRRYRGLLVKDAAARIGICRSAWSHLENGRPRRGHLSRPTFDMVAAMADAVGMRLMLAPKSAMDSRVATDDTLPVRTARNGKAGPNLLRIMDRVKSARESMGLSQAAAAARASWVKATWGHLERGYVSGRDIGIERVASAARAVELTVDVVADHHMPLLELDADEVAKVRGLIRWYRDHAPHVRQFDSIAEKLKLDTDA